jgi:uncharacterized protein YdaU (DUF1376 family)
MNPPAFQFYPDDFIGGTVDMTAEDCGAYIRLLCYQWGHGKAPLSKEAIDRVAGCVVSDHVLSKFRRGKNVRLEAERAKQVAYRQKQAINGAKGGRPEKPKPNPSLAFGLSQTEPKKSSPSPSPSPSTEHEREYARGREPDFPECNGNPTLLEVIAKAEMIGLLSWKAEDWFNEMQGCGWLDYQHRPVRDWASVLTRVKVKWEADGRPTSPPKARVQPNGERAKSPMDLKTIIQAKETTAAALRTRFCSDTAIDAIWSDNAKKQEFFTIKREIKQLTAQLSNMA